MAWNTAPTLTFTAPGTMKVAYPSGAPSGIYSGESDIIGYNVTRASEMYAMRVNYSYLSGSAAMPAGFVMMYGLEYGHSYEFWKRLYDGQTGDFYEGLHATYTVPDPRTVPVPADPPVLTGTVPTTVSVLFNINSDGGMPFTLFEMQYSPNADFSNGKLVSSTSPSFTVNDVTPGILTYFRIRSYNAKGVSLWGGASSIQLISGPRIKVAGVYKTTVCYVKYGGVWRVAVPYSKLAGVWRIAGG